MRLGVIGAGIQGNAIVDEFVRHSGAVQIGVLDRDRERLRRLASRYPDRRVVADALDASDLGRVVRWMRDYDAVVSAVPYRYNELLARAALLSGTHFTDLGGNNEVVEAELAVDAEARAQGVTLIPDLGLAHARGSQRELAAYAVRLRDHLRAAIERGPHRAIQAACLRGRRRGLAFVAARG
jgi:lysine 6-dehydrogenase